MSQLRFIKIMGPKFGQRRNIFRKSREGNATIDDHWMVFLCSFSTRIANTRLRLNCIFRWRLSARLSMQILCVIAPSHQFPFDPIKTASCAPLFDCPSEHKLRWSRDGLKRFWKWRDVDLQVIHQLDLWTRGLSGYGIEEIGPLFTPNPGQHGAINHHKIVVAKALTPNWFTSEMRKPFSRNLKNFNRMMTLKDRNLEIVSCPEMQINIVLTLCLCY